MNHYFKIPYVRLDWILICLRWRTFAIRTHGSIRMPRVVRQKKQSLRSVWRLRNPRICTQFVICRYPCFQVHWSSAGESQECTLHFPSRTKDTRCIWLKKNESLVVIWKTSILVSMGKNHRTCWSKPSNESAVILKFKYLQKQQWIMSLDMLGISPRLLNHTRKRKHPRSFNTGLLSLRLGESPISPRNISIRKVMMSWHRQSSKKICSWENHTLKISKKSSWSNVLVHETTIIRIVVGCVVQRRWRTLYDSKKLIPMQRSMSCIETSARMGSGKTFSIRGPGRKVSCSSALMRMRNLTYPSRMESYS